MTRSLVHTGLAVVVGIVMLPMYVMVGGWLIGQQRDFRTVGISLASITGLPFVMMIGIWVVGHLYGSSWGSDPL